MVSSSKISKERKVSCFCSCRLGWCKAVVTVNRQVDAVTVSVMYGNMFGDVDGLFRQETLDSTADFLNVGQTCQSGV